MTVQQLIAELQRMPQHLDVSLSMIKEIWFDGRLHSTQYQHSESRSLVADVKHEGSCVIIYGD